MKKNAIIGILVFSLSVLFSIPAFAVYPERPITLIVPFGAGGGSDVMARSLVKALEETKSLPVSVVIENKPGGSGAVGWSYVAKNAGNDYMITTTSGSFWNTPIAGQSPVNFRDFTPIAGVAFDPLTLCVRKDAPYKDLKELLEAAKTAPDRLVFAGTSAYAGDRVCLEMLKKESGIDIKHLSFKSGSEVVTALLGGHVVAAWANPSEAKTLLDSGDLRVLAVTTKERIEFLPEIPTFSELGYPGVFYSDMRGIMGPKDMSEEAVKFLADAFEKACKSDSWLNGYIKANMVVPQFIPTNKWAQTVEDQHYRFYDIFDSLGLAKGKR